MTHPVTLSSNRIPSPFDAIELYVAVGWGEQAKYDVAMWQNVLNATPILITAYAEDKLVGMLRALSDGFHETHLSDIVVHPDYQRRGIGKQMMQKFITMQSHTGIYIDGLSQNRAFFEACGFTVKEHMFVASRAPAEVA